MPQSYCNLSSPQQISKISPATIWQPITQWAGRWIAGNTNPVETSTSIPNYAEDLNAIHNAEKTLTREQQFEYHNHLWDLSECDENHGSCFPDGEDVMTPSGFTMLHATARQRAEAFLKTIGKWV